MTETFTVYKGPCKSKTSRQSQYLAHVGENTNENENYSLGNLLRELE
jgi:hypothetical protein